VMNSVFKLFGQSLFATRTSIILEVQRYEFSPRKVLFCFW
jgi:hypothetical protein